MKGANPIKIKFRLSDNKVKNYLFLYLVLFLYSLIGVLSKLAAQYSFFSSTFLILYGMALLILALYALLWQQILKEMPLAVAFSNKAVVVILGMLWGYLIFDEKITIVKLIAALIIFCGIYLVVTDNE